jgi:MFS family permease
MTSSEHPVAPALLALAGALSLAAAMGIGRFAFTPVLPVMLQEGLLDVGQGSWIAAANYVGYLVGALTAARMPLSAGALAKLALVATAALTAAMASTVAAAWLPLRFLAGIASSWVFVTTSVWCLGALGQRREHRMGGWIYAGVGVGIALVGLHGWIAATDGVPSASLWLQLGGLALLLALPVVWVIARSPRSDAPGLRIASNQSGGHGPRGLVVCYGVMGFGYILPATFLPVMARAVVDDVRVFSLAWPVFGVMAALSTLLVARLLYGTKRLKTWACCQLAMGVGVLLPAVYADLWAITVSACVVGGTFMVITLAGVQEMRARAPELAAGQVARATAAFALGQIAGPVVSALMLRASPRGLTLSLLMGACALIVTGGWLLRQSWARPETEVNPHG